MVIIEESGWYELSSRWDLCAYECLYTENNIMRNFNMFNMKMQLENERVRFSGYSCAFYFSE